MKGEYIDMLIEQLLRETLSGDRPRDLTERVISHAKSYDRVRRQWWMGAVSAIAASIAITAGLLSFWPYHYPVPEVVDGEVKMVSGEAVEHGSQLFTEDKPAILRLGGYVRVTMSQLTSLTLAGSKYEEKVMLAKGDIDVAVQKKKGTFDVIVGSATVHVTGTQFHVGVDERKTAAGLSKNLTVKVTEGSVVVNPGGGPSETLTTGEDRTFQISYEPSQVLPGGVIRVPARAGGGRAGRGLIASVPVPTPVPPVPVVEDFPFTERQPIASTTRPLQGFQQARVIAQTSRVETIGKLLSLDGTWYLLPENSNEPQIQLFSQQAPLDHMPAAGTRVHVVWENRKVVKIDEMSLQ